MTESLHYVVIGSGSAGHGAATTIRARDPGARITMITMSRLPFYNRYDLPKMFKGVTDWRDLLAEDPKIYDELGITLRRNSRVVDIDGRARTIALAHNEVIAYDKLLVCTGGGPNVPAILEDYRPLMHGFGTFEQASATVAALPPGGQVVILGGDMIGLDIAFNLLEAGYRVSLAVGEQTFWPHRVEPEERAVLLKSLARTGLDLIEDRSVVAIEAADRPARRVHFDDGSIVETDIVMPFFGILPIVDFMLGAGVDMERGILVDPALKSSNDAIWAAGDVCQIWSDVDRDYRFYHGWKNVRVMGELAARNMTGAEETFDTADESVIEVDGNGCIRSTFWEH